MDFSFDFAIVYKIGRVVKIFALHFRILGWQADNTGNIGTGFFNFFCGLPAQLNKFSKLQEICCRIATNSQLRKNHQIGSFLPGTVNGGNNLLGV